MALNERELFDAYRARPTQDGLLDLPRLGDQDWYAAGSNAVLAQQRENGSWKDAADDAKASSFSWDRETVDTCFAMLFLSRGTAPLAPAQDPPRR
jgi:hypothetical protein